MAYIGKKPTDVPLTAGDIPNDGISESKIADNAVESEHLNDNVISGQTALGATPADTDELLVSDAGTIKRVDFSHIKGGGKNALLHTVTASDVASVTFNNTYITSTYKDYLFTWSNVHSANDNVQYLLKISTDNGSSFKNDNDHRENGIGLASNSGSPLQQQGDSNTSFVIAPNNLGAGTGENSSGYITFFDILGTDNFKQWLGRTQYTKADGASEHFVLAGEYKKVGALNAIRFDMSAGNITSGVFKIYGVT